MMIEFAGLNWFAILTCVIVGQGFLTVWFVALFARPWALAYGVDSPKEHTKAIPGYTYAVGALCVFLLSIGLAVLQATLQVRGVAQALALGLFVALHFSLATAVPGYAFLKRWPACLLALGSQVALILILSTLLALWPR